MSDLFSKNFILMFSANLVLCMSFYMLMPLLPTYAVQELKINPGNVGVIIGVFSLSAVIMRPIAGVLLDRSSNKMKIYMPMVIIFSLSIGSYIIAASVATLLLFRVIHGFSWGGVSTSNATIVSDIVPSTMRGLGMGYFGLSMTFAMAIGPAFAVLLIGYISYNMIFFLAMLLSIGAFIASLFIKLDKTEKSKVPVTFFTLFEKKVFSIGFMEFCYGVSYIGILTYSTLYGLELGIKYLSFFFVIFAVAIGIFRPFAGKMVDVKGPTVILLSGFVAMFIGLLLIAFSVNTFMFLSGSFFAGMGSGFVMPTLMTMVVNTVEPSRRGAGNATLLVALDVGIGSGAMILGYISHLLGFKGMYILSALLLIVPILWYIFYEMKRHPAPTNITPAAKN